jgi:hypothetical protein
VGLVDASIRRGGRHPAQDRHVVDGGDPVSDDELAALVARIDEVA